MLYSDILVLWLEEKKTEIRNSSYGNYLYTMNKRVIPLLGSRDVAEINKKDIQAYIYGQSEFLKHETVVNITKVLSQSFNYAIDNGYIEISPFNKIKIPKDKGTKEIKVFTIKEVEKILSAKGYTQQKKNIVNTSYRTGARIGEILALKWEDINTEQGFLTIRRTLSGYRNGAPEICEPKTKGSRRRISLDKNSIEMFCDIHRNGEYVFCKKDGTILSRQCVYQAFKRMCKARNVQYHSFHSLRHTHASVLLAAGVHPKIVQERLGHSKISTTMDTYSHLLPGMQQVAVDVFNTMN